MEKDGLLKRAGEEVKVGLLGFTGGNPEELNFNGVIFNNSDDVNFQVSIP